MVNAIVYPLMNAEGVITDKITFTQHAQDVAIEGNINDCGIQNGFHAFHINTYGDISDQSNKTAPLFCKLQDIEAKDGTIAIKQTSDKISLVDGDKCILGKAVVVYAEDSCSTVSGGGEPIVWGVIGLSPGK